MERLKIVFVIATFVATAHTSAGQQLPVDAPDHPSVKQSFVVIGDVRNFNYFPLSERTTVRQAVMTAGVLSDSVSVSVIRASQDRSLWTQFISSTSADADELVMNGDILVAQSLLPVTEPVRKNAALRTDSGVIVVALSDEKIAVGDVLLQTGNQPSPGQQLNISSRFQGRTAIASATFSEQVAHGDVITVSRGNRSALKGFGNLAPAFSEWQNPVSAIPLRASIPQTGQLQSSAAGVLPDEQSYGFPMHVPTPFSDSSAGSTESGTPEAVQTAAIAASDIDTPLIVQSVSQAAPFADTEGNVTAPNPPIEVPGLADPVTAAASGGMGPWNLVFIGGLLIAGTLILASSLRADDETETGKVRIREQGPIQSAVLSPTANSDIHDDSDKTAATITTSRQSPPQFSPVSRKLARIVELNSDGAPQVVARTNGTPSGLVSPSEWLSGDWLGTQPGSEATEIEIRNPAAELVTQLTSIEVVLTEQETTPTAPEIPKRSLYLMEQQIADALADNRALVETIAKPDGQTAVDGIPESDAEKIRQAERSEISETQASTVQAVGFTDLEDLLQNRLPIDLCEARLPLRIALFGRPAGPRRLRIDAAHPTLPAPHMNRSAERKCEEAFAVSESQITAERQSSEAFGSLDRALHHLQERTGP